MAEIMDEQACLDAIEAGDDAYALLIKADPKLEQRFKRADKALIDLLAAVRQHFPDACYYTASGGFNLMLGSPHDDKLRSQEQLTALGGHARIEDGDF